MECTPEASQVSYDVRVRVDGGNLGTGKISDVTVKSDKKIEERKPTQKATSNKTCRNSSGGACRRHSLSNVAA